MMKTTYIKIPAKQIIYRPFKNMNEDIFLNDLNYGLSKIPPGNFSAFNSNWMTISDKHTLTKIKLLQETIRPSCQRNLENRS